jgi:hypothetical protein
MTHTDTLGLQALFDELDRRLKSEVARPRMSTEAFIELMRERDRVKYLCDEARLADTAGGNG